MEAINVPVAEIIPSRRVQQEETPPTYCLVDSKRRSWAKSVTWRVIGIVILGALSWMFTHSWEQTTLITITFHGIRLVLYYFHERAWEKVRWGRKKQAVEDYTI